MEMMYTLFKYLTLPGTLLKAFFEHLSCKIFKLRVEEKGYLSKGELCGHVEHNLSEAKGSFAICFIPFIMNAIIGTILILPASINLFYIGRVNFISILLLYLGISVLTNLFPLVEDSIRMWEVLFSNQYKAKKVSKIMLALPASILYIGSYFEKYCTTLFLAILYSLGLPYFIAFII